MATHRARRLARDEPVSEVRGLALRCSQARRLGSQGVVRQAQRRPTKLPGRRRRETMAVTAESKLLTASSRSPPPSCWLEQRAACEHRGRRDSPSGALGACRAGCCVRWRNRWWHFLTHYAKYLECASSSLVERANAFGYTLLDGSLPRERCRRFGARYDHPSSGV